MRITRMPDAGATDSRRDRSPSGDAASVGDGRPAASASSSASAAETSNRSTLLGRRWRRNAAAWVCAAGLVGAGGVALAAPEASPITSTVPGVVQVAVPPGAAAPADASKRRWYEPPDPVWGLRAPERPGAPPASVEQWLADRTAAAKVAAPNSEAAGAAEAAPTIILVHGLDDPGWVFKDFVVALRERGVEPLEMLYPNDGPIAESADLLAESLRALHAAGVTEVDIVAHSMGGLVTRDVLTRAEHYGGVAEAGDGLPDVGRFLMYGTPNHGSNAAHVRTIAEIREQLTRALSGRGHVLGGLKDGRGEAGRDLLPGSEFLTDLNDRPLPTGVDITVVIGWAGPGSVGGAEAAAAGLEATVSEVGGPGWWQRLVAVVGGAGAGSLRSVANAIGDGVVTLRSARLDGVDDTIVLKGNHATILARLTPVEGRPRGLDIGLERLLDDE